MRSLSRRELLLGRWARPVERAAPAGRERREGRDEPARAAPAEFSLDRLYAQRPASSTSLPVFAIRATASVATTSVGDGRPRPPWGAPSAASAVAEADAGGGGGGGGERQVAVWQSERCLLSSFCAVCVEHCPQPGALRVERGRLEVMAARCDGCGRCVAVCPAPQRALALAPRGAQEAS